MLVLKRKTGESLMIGDDIEIIVLERDADGIRLGIRAPQSFRVYRKEIYDEIKAANLLSLEANPPLEQLVGHYKNRMEKEEG